MRGIPTKYKGVQFRSRLEAKWAAFFDLLRWDWIYEPMDLDGWIPDFALIGENIHLIDSKPQKVVTTTLVEVKPVMEFPQSVADEIDLAIRKTDDRHETLIVGITPLNQQPHWDTPAIGWLGELRPDLDDLSWVGAWWEAAAWGFWANQKRYGFCHSQGCYYDRISGAYDGGRFGYQKVQSEIIGQCWAEAGNRVQWKAPR